MIITGASSGLGAALAQEFARRGASVTLFSPQEAEQAEVARQCVELGGKAVSVVGDVTLREDCERMVAQAVESFGGVDYLIANAGISMWARFEEVEDLDIFKRLIDINYLGAVNCVYFALPQLMKTGGMITAITSIQGKIGVPSHTGYVAAKHALQGFCESLRMELSGTGVDILTVLPHWLRGTGLRQNALSGSGNTLGESSRKHSSESVSVEEASVAIVSAIQKRRSELVIPWKLKLLMWLNLAKPSWAESIIRRAMKKQRN